jgi:hypothetical protein
VSGGFSANGDLSGTFVYQNVVGLRGRSISAEAPEDGYVLTWNDGYSAWEAAAPSGGGGFTAGGDLTGTSSSQTVAKINGITLSGTPSVGQVLTATSASAANWQTVSGAGVISVANLTALIAYSTAGLSTGVIAYVSSLKSYFILDLASALTNDGITVVNTASTGRWLRMKAAHPYWATQSSWYIDPISGDDENSGATSMLALATHAELVRRWGVNCTIKQSTTVYIVNDLGPTDLVEIDVAVSGGATLRYTSSAATVSRSGTLTDITNRDRSTNQLYEVEDTGVANWASDVGKRVTMTSGPVGPGGIRATAWVRKDLGASRGQMTEWLYPPAYYGAATPPTSTQTYDVETLPSMYLVNVRARRESGDVVTDWGYLIIENLTLIGSISGEGNLDRGYIAFNTSLDYVTIDRCKIEGYMELRAPTFLSVSNCYLEEGYRLTGANLYVEGGCTVNHLGLTLYGLGATAHVDGDAIIGGEGTFIAAGCLLEVGAAAFVECTAEVGYNENGSGIWMEPGAILSQPWALGGVRCMWGYGNPGTGIHMCAGSLATIAGDVVNTLTGTGGNISLGGSTVARAWDNSLGSYTTERSATWVNFSTAIGSGGHGGTMHDVGNSIKILSEEL